MIGLPILTYHGIEKEPGEFSWTEAEGPYVVSFASFEEQLRFIVKNGFSSLNLKELENWVQAIENKGSAPLKKVVLTFDDAHVSHLQYAAPVLRRNRLSAIFFVPAGFVGRDEHLNVSDLRSLVRDGFEVGSHGFSHVAL